MRGPLRFVIFAASFLMTELALVPAQVPSSQFRREFIGFDDVASCVAIHDGVLYVGGGFDRAGPVIGSCAILDPTSGAPDLAAPVLPGQTHVVAPDGEGGWYIGGVLGTTASPADPKIRHLLADGTFAAWSPVIDGEVTVIELTGDRVYIGGQFGVVAGQSRRKLAAFDRESGQLLPWNPSPSSWTTGGEFVTDILASGDTVFVSGYFDSVSFGGMERDHLVALSAVTGSALAWNPQPNDAVWAIEDSETGIIVGGNFTSIGGFPRNRLASLDPLTGASQPWNPSASSTVFALDRAGEVLYLGGFFTQVNGVARSRLAAVSVETGAVLPWNPEVSSTGGAGSEVTTLAVHDSAVYFGGEFTTVGGMPRLSAAAVSAETGAVLPWVCNLGGIAGTEINAVAATSDQVLFGGSFQIVATPRAGIAAIDIETGSLLPWNPILPSSANVNAIIATPSAIYIGGDFTTVNGQLRPDLAALVPATGALIPGFQPSFLPSSSGLSALELRDGVLYIGGQFQISGGGQNFAAVSATSGAPIPGWSTSASGSVRAIQVSEDAATVYIGGAFTQVGYGGSFVDRSRLAAFDTTTGTPTDWAPTVVGTVHALASFGTDLVVGGAFVSVNGLPRLRLARIDAMGAVLAWAPGIEGGGSTAVEALLPSSETILAGGRFDTIDGAYCPRVGQIDASNGSLGPWCPVPSSGDVYGLEAGSSVLAIAGSFAIVDGAPRPFLAVFDLDLGDYQFVRADGNDDGHVDLADAIFALWYLFQGQPPLCLAAQDANSDGVVDCADPVMILAYLFNSGVPPGAPFPECGPPPPSSSLDCLASDCP